MNSRTVIAGVLGLAGLAGAVRAETMPVVVELYTSQGCSSCPAADQVLLGLAGRRDVMALALHVDYWDYIGWVDSFADPAFSARQKAYASVAGEHMVYTPQMVVNGMARVIGNDAMDVMDAVRQTQDSQAGEGIALTVSRDGGSFHINATSDGAISPVLVQLVRYIPEQTVEIERGENAGRTITYVNIVTSWRVLGEWTGTGPLTLETAAEGDEDAVVILQRPGPGQILAVARAN